MAMKQQEVIKKFMASLDKSKLDLTSTEKKGKSSQKIAVMVAGQMLDEAVEACFNNSGIKTLEDAINKMLEDCKNAKSANDFLKNYCGINLDNKDTGAITGKDAGSSTKEKTAESVIQEGALDTNFKKNVFEINGLTVKFGTREKNSSGQWKNPTAITLNDLTPERQWMWQQIHSNWISKSLKVITDSYGENFSFSKNSSAVTKTIWIIFDDTIPSSSGDIAITYGGPEYSKESTNEIKLHINVNYYKNMDTANENGISKDKNFSDSDYLDRTFAHELTHAVMRANINYYDGLPSYIKEGIAEITHGRDGKKDNDLKKLADNYKLLKEALIAETDSDNVKVSGVSSPSYAAGYMFMRYLAKQAAESSNNVGLNVTNSTKNSLVSGTAYADKIKNIAGGAKIYARAGNDSIYNRTEKNYTINSSWGYVTIDGGEGKDTINNNDPYVKIDGGKDDDIISVVSSGFGYVTINGGEGKDSIRNSEKLSKIYGDSGADSIVNTNYATNATVYGGIGDDTISNTGNKSKIYGDADNDFIINYGENVTITGGAGNDHISLSSSSKNNLIFYNSGEGNDTIAGISAKDTIQIIGAEYEKVTLSSSKNVTLKVGSGLLILENAKNISFKIDGKEKVSNIISLTSGNDTTVNSASGKTIYALAGKDNIENKGANVTIYGGAGNDSILNRQSNVLIYGENDADSVINASTNVTVYGGTANDTLENHSASKSATIHGDTGNDVIKNNGTKAVLYGGAGNDIISLGSYSKNATINGGAGNDTVTLYGGGNVVQYSNGDGKDVITGFSTTDTLYIASGTVSKVSISGNDAFLTIGSGSVNLKAVKGKTVKLKNSSGIVTETIFGGETLPAGITVSNSVVKASSSFTGNKIDLANYSATKVDASALSKAVSIVGTAVANSLKGGKGADIISGGAGNDTVSLGSGNDIYIYSSGNDLIQDYVAGQDKIKLTGTSITSSTLSGSNVIFKTAKGNITVQNGKNKKITVIDSSGRETSNIYPLSTLPAGITISNSVVKVSTGFTGNKIDLASYAATKVDASALSKAVSIVGTAAANSLKGGKGADTISGGAGNDTILGGNGNDYISGDSGNDILKGEVGNDTLNGGLGNDTLTGGAGNDTFIYSGGSDTITDYTAGADKIKIASGKISKTAYSGKNVIFTIGSGTLTVQNGKGKKISVIDSSNKSATYSKTFNLFEDNNFISDAPQISEIAEQKFSVTQIQTQTENYNSLVQDDKIFLTYTEK